jgi:hypothetical protein
VTWYPPEGSSNVVVVAIDPPRGWCVFSASGVVGAGQGDDMWQERCKMREALRAASPGGYYSAVVEQPYGGARKNNIREIVMNAMAAGWWLRELHREALVTWTPNASTWRMPLGFPSPRELAKRHALMFVDVVCEVQRRPLLRGPKGGLMEHASEAVCMAVAFWLRTGLVHRGDVVHRVIERLHIPYTGGTPLKHSALTPIQPSSFLNGKLERKRMSARSWKGAMEADDEADGRT